jgi:hypothetical protein
MPALSQLQISNLAIARLPAKEIASIDESSLEARECRRFYSHVVTSLLEGPHEWSFGNKRQALAAVTNDRPNEWLYAYAIPSDCGSPIRVIPLLSCEPHGCETAWVSAVKLLGSPYEINGAVLYTNAEDATLEYVVNDVSGLNVSRLFIEALRLKLASDLAIPVKQDTQLRQAILGEAEIAEERAIADDRDRQPEETPDYTPENLLARHDVCPSFLIRRQPSVSTPAPAPPPPPPPPPSGAALKFNVASNSQYLPLLAC